MNTTVLKDCPWCGQWTRFSLRDGKYVCRSCDRDVEDVPDDPEVALTNGADVVVRFPSTSGRKNKSPNGDKPKSPRTKTK
jgi:uncharacterized Zn finger protein (UPF0148 family)